MAQLTKSRNDRVFFGVCGGLARHFDVDPSWVRIGFVAATLLGGPGFVAYLICMFVIPQPKSLYESERRALTR